MDYNVGHPTSQPIGEDVVFREKEFHVDPEFSTGDATVSNDEAEFFKAKGYLVKRGLIDEPEVFRQVVDCIWDSVPRDIIQRDDPASWLDAPHEQWTDEDAESVGLFASNNWKLRSRGANGIGTESFLVDGVANHPKMRAVVESFIGRPVQSTNRVRGIYCIFPKPPSALPQYGVHADYMAANLSAMVVAAPMPANSGGFTVWPGSHRRLHPFWDTCYGSTIDTSNGDGYARERDAILREVAPVEFSGEAGDVIFWHPRLLHSGGTNHSAKWDRPIVRMIVPCDFQRADRGYFDDLQYGPGPDYQWWIDTRNFHGDEAPTPDNLWNEWAI